VAKKSRTPPPPRRVQAPKQRATKRDIPADKSRRYLYAAFAAAGLIGIVIATVILAKAGGGANDQGVARTLRASGCTYTTHPATSQQHVRSVNVKVKYNSFPPSNGPHFSSPALWGNFSDPVEPVQAVHNLEHGGMLIEYGPGVSSADREAINRFYDESPNGMLVFPYAPLKKRIALVAWTADLDRIEGRTASGGYHGEGRVSLCKAFNEKAFKLFRDRFRAKGPERLKLDQMPPAG
jgi:hypothetical protein